MTLGNRFWNCDRYMDLTIFVNSDDDDLRQLYLKASEKHNQNMMSNAFFDAGFDLFLPRDYPCSNSSGAIRLNFSVKCAATMVVDNGRSFPSGFYLYPRSSLSKTELRLANSVGIIDSGYRGDVMGAFDCFVPNYFVYKRDRLVQICAPGLVPIYVRVVFDEALLGDETERGSGGFGSTTSV